MKHGPLLYAFRLAAGNSFFTMYGKGDPAADKLLPFGILRRTIWDFVSLQQEARSMGLVLRPIRRKGLRLLRIDLPRAKVRGNFCR